MSNVDEQAIERSPKYKSRRGRRILGLILAMLVLLLAVVTFFLVKMILPAGNIKSGEEAGGLEWVRSIYGWGNGEKEQLFVPGSVAIGPDGTIWSTSPNNTAIVGFRPDGSFRAMLNGDDKNPLLNPTDLAVDPQGRIYVAENTVDTVRVLTPGDEEILNLKVQSPTALAATSDRIIIGSAAGFAILDKEGNPIKVVGMMGKGEDQFDSVGGVAVGKDGTIFVTDTYNNRVSAYDKQGTRLWMKVTGNPGNKSNITGIDGAKVEIKQEAKLQLPLQIAIDANGRVAIIDPFDFGVTVLNPKDGSLVAKYGAYGTDDGQMYYPSGIAYDAQRDWFAVADTGNNRVQIFRMPGSGSSAMATVRRSLTGPIRACLLPLILLVLALIVAAIGRRRRKMAAKAAAAAGAQTADVEPQPAIAETELQSAEG